MCVVRGAALFCHVCCAGGAVLSCRALCAMLWVIFYPDLSDLSCRHRRRISISITRPISYIIVNIDIDIDIALLISHIVCPPFASQILVYPWPSLPSFRLADIRVPVASSMSRMTCRYCDIGYASISIPKSISAIGYQYQHKYRYRSRVVTPFLPSFCLADVHVPCGFRDALVVSASHRRPQQRRR